MGKICLSLQVARKPLEDFEQKRMMLWLIFVKNHSGCSVEKRPCRSKHGSRGGVRQLLIQGNSGERGSDRGRHGEAWSDWRPNLRVEGIGFATRLDRSCERVRGVRKTEVFHLNNWPNGWNGRNYGGSSYRDVNREESSWDCVKFKLSVRHLRFIIWSRSLQSQTPKHFHICIIFKSAQMIVWL